MARLIKTSMPSGTDQLQDDHYRRINDICFRHLAGAWTNYQNQSAHRWIKDIKSDDPRYGHSDYKHLLVIHEHAVSEEYTHSIAATLFAHVWVLSAANLYQFAPKSRISDIGKFDKKRLKRTNNPQNLAEDLNLSTAINNTALELHCARNTIAHLVSGRETYPIDKLGFKRAYGFVQCSWEIYIALLEYYEQTPHEGDWKNQTKRYDLPSSIAKL